jgi:hypothetical protein
MNLYLTNFRQQNACWEADSRSYSQDNLCLLRKSESASKSEALCNIS